MLRPIYQMGEKGKNVEINCMHISGFPDVAQRAETNARHF
jgi:hypothetical protein